MLPLLELCSATPFIYTLHNSWPCCAAAGQQRELHTHDVAAPDLKVHHTSTGEM
jgi:hypothetical protein